jgi:hypothetical protein
VRQFRVAIVLKTAAALIAVSGLIWVAASAGIYLAMSQTPERFGAIMARVPRIAMMVLPFKPLWMSARAGSLRIGDPAPDFTLPVLHDDRSVTLSAEFRRKPVVLIFGSYT